MKISKYSYALLYIFCQVFCRNFLQIIDFSMFTVKFKQKRLCSCGTCSVSAEIVSFSQMFFHILVGFSCISAKTKRFQKDFTGTEAVNSKICFVLVMPTQFRLRVTRFWCSRNIPCPFEMISICPLYNLILILHKIFTEIILNTGGEKQVLPLQSFSFDKEKL